MTEHTQSTWEASGDQVVTIDGNSIADVYGGHTMDEIEANTRLIAAAPELLDSNINLVSYVRALGHLDDPTVRALLDMGDAAIAKARGAK